MVVAWHSILIKLHHDPSLVIYGRDTTGSPPFSPGKAAVSARYIIREAIGI